MLVLTIRHLLTSSMIIVYISRFCLSIFFMRLFCVCIDTRLMRTQEFTIQRKIMIITNRENCSFFLSLRSIAVYSSLLFINEMIFFPISDFRVLNDNDEVDTLLGPATIRRARSLASKIQSYDEHQRHCAFDYAILFKSIKFQ